MRNLLMTLMMIFTFSITSSSLLYAVSPDTLIEPVHLPPQENNPDTLVPPDTLLPPDPVEAPEDKTSVESVDQQIIGYAVVELNATEGNKGSGRLLFSRVTNGIKITGKVVGLTPGLHGIHIHEFGDCSAPDASSAGGHFNPDNMPHAGPEDTQRHVGDLGNLEANDQGIAIIDVIDTKISFEGANSIIGKSVVVHAGRDDLKSQPAGDSGGRILCGVIENSEQ
jgi:superoxide dismutase, Cu-Zn family